MYVVIIIIGFIEGCVFVCVCLSPCSVSFIVGDFSRRGVDISSVAWQREGETPCACCVVCPPSGSRTVVLSDT